MNKFQEFCEELESDILRAYTENVPTEEAERLAAKFLLAQLEVGRELASVDLDARTKKTGLKAFKAAVYLDHISKHDKKPTESQLAALVDSDKLVGQEQDRYDATEVDRNRLENYLHVFRDGHLYFRAISKGRFE